MVMTIRKALDHEMITVIEQEKTPGIVKFRLGEIPTVITVRLIVGYKSTLDVSHRIKTPKQPSSYLPAFRDCKYPGDAMKELVVAFVQPYKAAVRDHYRPDETWLVANPYFGDDAN